MTPYRNFDNGRNGVWFSIDIAGEEYLAFVSAAALSSHFNAAETMESQLAAFKQNEYAIAELARRKFLKGAMRPVKLNDADFIAERMVA
ncbi:MAG: hypothetical protein JWR25_1804 [Noviherbaspirillum sp.]|nr:hypothetical protein [Noviherbaspirillum sp.]